MRERRCSGRSRAGLWIKSLIVKKNDLIARRLHVTEARRGKARQGKARVGVVASKGARGGAGGAAGNRELVAVITCLGIGSSC